MKIKAFARRMAAALVLGLAGASVTGSPARASHDELTIGISQFPSSLHPYIEAEDVKLYVLGFVTPRVTGYGEGAKLSCLLCTQVPTVQNGLAKIEDRADGQKGMAVTLELTPGLKWGDGEPVTAKDIAFTARVAADPKSGFSLPKGWAKIDKVEIVDDRKAIIHLNSLYVSYNEWAQLLPEHVEGPAYEKTAGSGGYNKESVYNRAPMTAGLYDGPYLIKDYQSGAQIVLEPNPYWNGAKPQFKRIILKFIGNTAALEANLLSGDVDMVAEGGIGLTVDQALELRKKYPDRFIYMFEPNLFMEHIELAHDNPMLQDLRVRQALVYAADRKTLTEKLFENMLPVASSFVPPSHANAAKDLPALPYDPAKAKALLARGRLHAGPRRHLPQRQGGAALVRVHHDGRQSRARARATSAAIELESRLHRGDDQERAGPHHVRRDAEEADIHRNGDVRLRARDDQIAAQRLHDERHPDRGQWLWGLELFGHLDPAFRRAHRFGREGVRPAEAEAALGRDAEDLRHAIASGADLLSGRRACRAQMAQGLHAVRHRRRDLQLVLQLAGRMTGAR